MIRTLDPLFPKQVRYQAALRPDTFNFRILLSLSKGCFKPYQKKEKLSENDSSRGNILESFFIIIRSAYAPFIAALTFSAVIGHERTLAPVALNIALATAGPTTVVAGSPQPAG